MKNFGETYSGLEYDYRGLLRVYGELKDYESSARYSMLLSQWKWRREQLQTEQAETKRGKFSQPSAILHVFRKLETRLPQNFRATTDSATKHSETCGRSGPRISLSCKTLLLTQLIPRLITRSSVRRAQTKSKSCLQLPYTPSSPCLPRRQWPFCDTTQIQI